MTMDNTLTLKIESPQLMEHLKHILSLMKGVKIINAAPTNAGVPMADTPNATTLSAMHEATAGEDAGVVRIDSIEHFMASMDD